MIRTYTELLTLETFEERFEYLRLRGSVGQATFGFDRYLNQLFYRSQRWRQLRNEIIIRDGACDLAMFGFDIHDRIFIHHMNPLTEEDLLHDREHMYDPEFLICTSFNTHNAIHYSDTSLLKEQYVERQPGDTILW